MFKFQRQPGQDIAEYNSEWSIQYQRVVEQVGELTLAWQAHLYLRKMRIGIHLRTSVLTAANQKYTVEALAQAAMFTIPSIREAKRANATGAGRRWPLRN